MAAAKKKKPVSRKPKPKAVKPAKDISLGEIESEMEEMTMNDFAESTKKDLKKLGELIHEAADKGTHIAKEIAEDMRIFARDARNLTMIKMEIHNLENEREKLYCTIGKRLTTLNRTKKLTDIKTKFKKDFSKLAALDSSIKKNKKQAGKISLTKSNK